MSYTGIVWVDGSGGGTPMSAANLNILDVGIKQCVYRDGTNGFTAVIDHNITLGGSDRSYITITASDGKAYAFRQINSSKALMIRNTTDSADLLELGPAAGTIKAGGNTVWHSGNDGAGSGLDADLLDGHNTGSGNGLDADMVDGNHATAFPLVGTGSGFASRTIGVGDLAHRPAAGNKGAIYIETPFS